MSNLRLLPSAASARLQTNSLAFSSPQLSSPIFSLECARMCVEIESFQLAGWLNVALLPCCQFNDGDNSDPHQDTSLSLGAGAAVVVVVVQSWRNSLECCCSWRRICTPSSDNSLKASGWRPPRWLLAVAARPSPMVLF